MYAIHGISICHTYAIHEEITWHIHMPDMMKLSPVSYILMAYITMPIRSEFYMAYIRMLIS